jgi:hypothetical protein
MPIANVALTDTFDQWRIKTNQLILANEQTDVIARASANSSNAAFARSNTALASANSAVLSANAAFNKANTALANSTGTLAGTLTVTGNVIVGSNTVYHPGNLNLSVYAPLAGAMFTGLLRASSSDGVTSFMANGASKGVRFVPSASGFSIEGVDNTGAATYQPLSIGGSSLTLGTSGGTALTITGGITTFANTPLVGANTVYHTGNFNPALKADLTGATFTGPVVVSGAAGTNKLLRLYTNATARWDIATDAVAESGANTGANFIVNRYTDAGTLLGTSLSVNRATGVATFETTPLVGANTVYHTGNFNPALKADLTGATFSGSIGIQTGGSIFVDNSVANGSFYTASTPGTVRWQWGRDGTAESGSNAGSNFQLNRYSDASAFLGTPISISRATGVVTFATNPTVAGNGLYHAGNFNPASYALLSGASFTGSVGTVGQLSVTNSGPLVSLTNTSWGVRHLHAASGLMGFLSNGGAWTMYSDNSGNLTAIGNVTAYSDPRLKKNLVKISNSLAKVSLLNGYTYERIDNGEPGVGLLSTDVENVIPEAVQKSGEYDAVNYGGLVGLLVEAIKELTARVEYLEADRDNDGA